MVIRKNIKITASTHQPEMRTVEATTKGNEDDAVTGEEVARELRDNWKLAITG